MRFGIYLLFQFESFYWGYTFHTGGESSRFTFGKSNDKGGTLVYFASYFYGATMVFYILVGNKQPQTGAAVHGTFMLGGEIGVKDGINARARNTFPCICNFDVDGFGPISFFSAAGDNFNFSSLRCKIDGI